MNALLKINNMLYEYINDNPLLAKSFKNPFSIATKFSTEQTIKIIKHAR